MRDLSLTQDNDNISENDDFMIQKQSENNNSSNEISKRNTSGTGILEFSPNMAGQDVTPVNLDFASKRPKKTVNTNSSFQTLAGKLKENLL